MRFKKGNRVEVMNNWEIPNSWHPAEILNGNGHTYSVRLDHNPAMLSGSAVERVSREFVRPCPPTIIHDLNWMVGDVVEVFQDFSWKIATIFKVLQGNIYLVRLLGSSIQCRMRSSNIRELLLWVDEKWISIGKRSGAFGVGQQNKMVPSNLKLKITCKVPHSNPFVQSQAPKDCVRMQNKERSHEPQELSSRSLKRMSPDCSIVVGTTKNVHGIRLVEKERKKQKVVAPVVLSREKVDVVAYQNGILGDLKPYPHSRNNVNDDSDNVASSIGSCSVVSRERECSSGPYVPVTCHNLDTYGRDPKSLCGLENDVDKHRLELQAYRSTLVALHASGPLSWDQEALLTNLRSMLHVSNDEHSMELKNLLSPESNAYLR